MRAGHIVGEDVCRDILLGRTAGLCEGCRTTTWTDKAHRLAASQGGRWTPDNILGLCRACHAWSHAQPTDARAAGWILPSGTVPAAAPVWLVSASVWPGWYLLGVDGWHHAAEEGPPPPLPPHFPAGLLPPRPIPLPRGPA